VFWVVGCCGLIVTFCRCWMLCASWLVRCWCGCWLSLLVFRILMSAVGICICWLTVGWRLCSLRLLTRGSCSCSVSIGLVIVGV